MLDKIGKFIKRMFLIFLLLSLVIYLGIAYFYKDVFMVNTWINGVYCTGKSVEEVNTELLLQTKAPFLTITNKRGKSADINMAEVSYKVDYTESLNSYIKNQNVLIWPIYLLEQKYFDVMPIQSWNEESLILKICELDIVKEEVPDVLKVEIVLGEQGYELHDNLSEVFHPEVFAEYVNTNLKKGELYFDISKSNAYRDIDATDEQLATRELWDKLQEFLKCNIVYDMGTEMIPLDYSITSHFVKTDESGNFSFDEFDNFQMNESGIDAFIDELALEYNTCDTQLAFAATRGETVMVDYVTYGTELDVKAEKEYLKNAFEQKLAEVHIPAYLQEGYVRGKNDIGNTYIEVDMTKQKLYCYKAGEIILETDIVTGNMKRKWNTPEGVNYVYAKQKKRVLRGPGYATPVDFWMPVKGSIGLHDADWRKEFGGEIYLTNGSHGCVNIPPEHMPFIYDEYEIGTPVIMFY